MQKLAIVASHPIQYYAPWFRFISLNTTEFQFKVFYLWDSGIVSAVDTGFQQSIQWDIPLLQGYDHEFIANTSSNPGTHHFWGLQNPTLLSQVSAYQPDAVWLMNYNYASLYRFISSWNTRKAPLLFRGDSHHLFPRTGIKEKIRRKIVSTIYSRIDAFLYVGKANREYFSYHGVPDEKLFLSPHAIDNSRFISQATIAAQQAQEWKQELGIPHDHQVILFAGKFIEKKRPLDLLDAFFKAQLNKVSLLFVGSGTLSIELKAKSKEHAHVYFAPFQNQTQMPRAYAIADIVVLPSYGIYETWGLAINEAMCLSRPVIVSSHVGCAQDLVHPYENGLIFPAGDIQALADALTEAFSDPARLKKWGQNSQEIVSRYSYEQSTEGLLQALAYLQGKP